jgi:hypothetical protein
LSIWLAAVVGKSRVDGQAVERERLAGGDARIGALGLGQRGVFVEGEVGAELGPGLGAGQEMLGGLDGRDLARAQLGGQRRETQGVQISGHGMRAGKVGGRPRDAARAGAGAANSWDSMNGKMEYEAIIVDLTTEVRSYPIIVIR